MRHFAAIVLLALSLLAADGWYRGNWEASDGNGGKLNVRLEPQPELTFTLDGSEFKARNVEVKRDGDSLDITFEYTMENEMRGTLKGTRTEKSFEGKWTASVKSSGEFADSGTFKLTASE